MTAPRCSICFDTGMADDSDMLDCTACSAPTDRAALNAYVKYLGPMSQEDLIWLVHQRAVSSELMDAVERMRKAAQRSRNPGKLPDFSAAHEYQAAVQNLIAAAILEKTK